MDRYQIIRIIHDYMSSKPVLKAWLFGSFARGEERLRASMRHVLVHGYSQVLPRILWATAKENIPEIKAQVEKYLNEIDWEHYCGE